MEQNLPIMAKKFWKMVKVVYFMLRKGISKAKVLSNFNAILKRGKLAGKAAMHGLISHHDHHHDAADEGHQESQLAYPTPLDEYEFSCSNTPKFNLPFKLNKRKNRSPKDGELFAAAFEVVSSQAASPALPGFGRTPMARQLRITDSPYPLPEIGGEDGHVDEAAENFIRKFYKELRQQN